MFVEMIADLDAVELEEALGPDLSALIHDRRSRLTAFTEITTLPSPVRNRAAFALDFDDGMRLKGRRLKSVEQADRVARLLPVIGHGFPRIIERRGDAMLLEWVEGQSVAALDPVPAHVVRRCGRLLGSLHALDAEALIGQPLPRGDALLNKFERNALLLRDAQVIDRVLCRRALDSVAGDGPEVTTQGIIHKDFCDENIVWSAAGSPVSIDNASLSIGFHDLDLARTWYRWPMSRRDRAEFAAGYQRHRDLAPFLEHFVFWATHVLVGAAASRLRTRARGVREPLERLERLFASAADQGHAFRAV